MMEDLYKKTIAEAYLDIETTGLSHQYHEITVVGIYVCIGATANLFQFIGNEITADNILESLKGVNQIYTYNGKSFDLPFIYSRLGADLAETFTHHDLMYDCHANNLYGGCKEAERLLGIERQLKGIDGLDAIELWKKYIEQNDENALSILCEYNKEDVLMLKALKEKLGVIPSITDGENIAEKGKKREIRGDKSLSIAISIDDVRYNRSTLAGLEFVITGRLVAFSREEAQAKVKALGGIAKDNVTKNTAYLVVGEDPGGSKLTRAAELGTRQITEAEFLRLIGETQN